MYRGRRPEEEDAVLHEAARQLGVLRGMPPPRPDGVDVQLERRLGDDLDVVVVVGVGPAGHADDVVGQLHVLGVGGDVFGGGHAHELDGCAVAKGLVRPSADRADGFGGAHCAREGRRERKMQASVQVRVRVCLRTHEHFRTRRTALAEREREKEARLNAYVRCWRSGCDE